MAAIRGVQVAWGTIQVISHPPDSVTGPATVAVTADGWNNRRAVGGLTVIPLRFRCRLYIPWQHSETAEARKDELMLLIPAAIDADPQLAGAVTSGMAEVPDANSGFSEVSGTKFRAFDCFVVVTYKEPYAGAP